MRHWQKIIGIYEIVGGIIGIGIIIFFGTPQLATSSPTRMFLGLFVFGIFAGHLLQKGDRLGIYFSLFFQALQVPAFSVGLEYKFYAATAFFIGGGLVTLESQFMYETLFLASRFNFGTGGVPVDGICQV